MNARELDPKPPRHLTPAGRRLWRALVQTWELDAHHLRLLELACTASDRAEAARAALERDGLTVRDRFGQSKVNPLVEIEHQARNDFRLLVRELGLQDDEPRDRPPRLGRNR